MQPPAALFPAERGESSWRGLRVGVGVGAGKSLRSSQAKPNRRRLIDRGKGTRMMVPRALKAQRQS